MQLETDEVIQRLTASAHPVRPLAPPRARAATWLVLAIAYSVLVVLAISPRADYRAVLTDSVFLIQGVAGIAGAALAATAAFAATVPGYPNWRAILLMVLPAGWLLLVAGSSVTGWAAAGAVQGSIPAGWQCLPVVLVFAAVPAIVIGLQLRRDAPLAPTLTLALGALAAGILADVGTRLCHGADSAAHLVWHVGGAVLLVLAAARAGTHVLQWRRAA